MICKRTGSGVDGGGKETTTQGGEEEMTMGWREMGGDVSGEKVVVMMKQLVTMVVAVLILHME